MSRERVVCTAEHPWKQGDGPAIHEEAVFVNDEDHDGGTCAVYRCPHCWTTFHVELAD